MKLQIIEDESQKIDGFETILASPNLDLGNIPDNSCEVIIAKGALDKMSNPLDCLNLVCSKLRSNGSVVISGTELRCFFKNVINGITDESSASAVIGNSLSLSTVGSVKNALRSLGLFIKSSTINGAFYEITAERRVG